MWPAIAPILKMLPTDQIVDLNLSFYWQGLHILDQVSATRSLSSSTLAFTATAVKSLFPIFNFLFQVDLQLDQLSRLLRLLWFYFQDCLLFSSPALRGAADFILSSLPELIRLLNSSKLRDVILEFLLALSAASFEICKVVANALAPQLLVFAPESSAASASLIAFPIIWALQPSIQIDSSVLTAALQSSCEAIVGCSSNLASLLSDSQSKSYKESLILIHTSALLAHWCTPASKVDSTLNCFEAKLLKATDFSFNHKYFQSFIKILIEGLFFKFFFCLNPSVTIKYKSIL